MSFRQQADGFDIESMRSLIHFLQLMMEDDDQAAYLTISDLKEMLASELIRRKPRLPSEPQ
jgi:hypothetical protein